MELPSVFQRYRVFIDQELRAALAEHHSPVYDMLRYHLGWIDEQSNPLSQPGGKALRPTLCLLTNEALSGAFQQALPAAAAIELVHNFSLIHDDVQDDDRERRNRPTVWAIWGKPQAINAGTAMRVLAGVSMMRLLDHGLPAEKLLKALLILDESSLRLIEGQYLDISFEQRFDVCPAEYLKMAEGKTAALIACAFELGAMLATEEADVIQAFRNCGHNLGLAFQIKDDLLGIWGDRNQLGKPVGSDILRKKKTFPIVFAWEMAKTQTRAKISGIYQREMVTKNDCDAILNILDDLHAREQSQAMVTDYSDRAWAKINHIPLSSWAHNSLAEVIQFLTQREY